MRSPLSLDRISLKNVETGMRAGGIPQDRPRLFLTPKLHCSLHGLQLVPFHAKTCEGPSNSIAHPTPRCAAGPLRTLVPNPQVYRSLAAGSQTG
jgi:hypothetical protein